MEIIKEAIEKARSPIEALTATDKYVIPMFVFEGSELMDLLSLVAEKQRVECAMYAGEIHKHKGYINTLVLKSPLVTEQLDEPPKSRI